MLRAGFSKGDYQVDITSAESIENLFRKVGSFDALISIAGSAHLGPIQELSERDFMVGIGGKLLAQINLVLIGQQYINANGSFTLTSGILAEDPILTGTACTVADAGINAFVISAAQELKQGVRINAVAPGVVRDSPQLHAYFPGHIPVEMEKVSAAYLRSVLGAANGKVFRAY